MTSKDFAEVVWDAEAIDDCRHIIRLAVREDLGRGYDLTTLALVSAEAKGSARIVAREAGVLAGLPAVDLVLEETNAQVILEAQTTDGDRFGPGQCLAVLTGKTRDILTLERIVLNLLGRLSGIATLTRRYVDAVEGTAARIYDTRKTTPGWRRLEKYAVRRGGGFNHRTGLFDAVLIKDNHLAQASCDVATAVRTARTFLAQQPEQLVPPNTIVEVEVDTLVQLSEALAARPDIVLLDNMNPGLLEQAVQLRDQAAPQVELEASGGINFETVRSVAETGVDRISVGALTHAACALDVGLDWN